MPVKRVPQVLSTQPLMEMLSAALGPNVNGLLIVPAPPVPGPVVTETDSPVIGIELRLAELLNVAESVELPPAQDQVPPAAVLPSPVNEKSTLTVLANADAVKNNAIRVTIEGINLFTYIVCPFIQDIAAGREES